MRLLAPNSTTRRDGGGFLSDALTDRLPAASAVPTRVGLQRRVTLVGQKAKHDRHIDRSAAKTEHSQAGGREYRKPERLNDPFCGVLLQEHLPGDLAAVERVDRQQVQNPPDNVDKQPNAQKAFALQGTIDFGQLDIEAFQS